MARWPGLLAAAMLFAHSAYAAEDDPALAAALSSCPGASAFVKAEAQRQQKDSRAAVDVAPANPRLQERLLEMRRVDQEVRAGDWSQPMIEKMLAVDAANLPMIKKIVAEHGGLPPVREVGADGVAAAWLLVQHADRDVDFQRQVLENVMPLVESGDVQPDSFALLTDRVLVNSGKPQRYGSQLIPVDGRWQPQPMEGAIAQVNQRRAEVHLMALEDYICVVTQMLPVPVVTNAAGATQK